MSAPLLSVCLITYNHVKFIRQAIEGVMMQQVNFSWELIIADDCSTDGTHEILLEYKKKYPDFVKLILQKENVGPAKNWIELITTPKSKYIAYFEGDDYWTDPKKLQQQVNYLECNAHVSICLHNAHVEENGIIVGVARGMTFKTYSLLNVVQKRVLAPSASFVFRNSFEIPHWVKNVYGGDSALLFLLAQKGEIHYLPDVMCVYRKNSSSLESQYRNRPMEKALRDINDYKIYLTFIIDEHKGIILKKIVWCYFYRFTKGLQILVFRSVPLDLINLVKYSMLFIYTRLNLLLVQRFIFI